MITPAQWIHTMQQGTNAARAFVVEQARIWLAAHPHAAEGYSTTELSAALWPPHHAIGEAIELRKRMVDLLLKCARSELADCAYQGPPKRRSFMGKTAKPWLWRAPPVGEAIHVAGMTGEETRSHLIAAIKFAPVGQNMLQMQAAQIADIILSRASVVFKQGGIS